MRRCLILAALAGALLAGCAGPVSQPAPGAPFMTFNAIYTADGADLPLRSFVPAGEPRAAVVALHGFNDYSNAFSEAGLYFMAHGVALYAYDQRGFGDAPARGLWVGQRQLIDDVRLVVALVRRQHPGVPVFLIGESMGGALAMVAMADPNPPAVDGVILVAPAVWGRQTMNVVERVGLWLTDLIPAMTLSLDHLPVSFQPSDNIPMLHAFSADPLVLKTTRADTVNGLVDLMTAALATGRRFDAPLFVLYGAHDEIVPRESLARFVEELPARAAHRQRIALYPQGYHMLLRDLEGQVPIADVAAWVRDTAAPLPSGADDARAQLTGHAAPATAARDEGLRARARG